jgi:hypothetical protein
VAAGCLPRRPCPDHADEVEAQIADSTYIARIVRPTDWEIPANRPGPVV